MARDDCPTTSQNDTLWVPNYFGNDVSDSGTGFYFYGEDYGGDNCHFYVEDVMLGGYSNCDGAPVCTPLAVHIGPYNLPGSAATGGAVPIVQADCNSYNVRLQYYQKIQGATSFTAMGYRHWTGTWIAGECALSSSGTLGYPTVVSYNSSSGWEAHRFAAYAFGRDSAERVRITVADYIN